MIEELFDTPLIAQLAQREKQIQQSYRPIIGVHKWFARRPGALFRGLLLSEFVTDRPLAWSYFGGHDLGPRIVGDPFMGGGTPLFEASRLGCHVVGTDSNPMAYWIVRQELAPLDLDRFRATAKRIAARVEKRVGQFYTTTCTRCGDAAPVKYFLWVKQQPCGHCGHVVDLYSSYVLAKNQRHPNYVLICPNCSALNETPAVEPSPGTCYACGTDLLLTEPGGRNRAVCRSCGHEVRYGASADSPPEHALYAIEYHCPRCAASHAGRFFKAPDRSDIERYQAAQRLFAISPQDLVPDEEIPPGDETARLHRWGYRSYRQLFNARQLLGLQTLVSEISRVEETEVREALLTVFSDTLRYQNMLCRYDSYALKILDIFSVHGFPVSVTQCENSLLGIAGVGSGGFRHFVKKYCRAKVYGDRPFEKSLATKKKIYQGGEHIGARLVDSLPERDARKSAYLEAMPGAELTLPKDYLDAVLTDPPYFGNVQYAELMDFCYVWLRKHLLEVEPAFRPRTTRTPDELTVNDTEGRGIEHFTAGLSSVFCRFAEALKPMAPFVFTYHHNKVQAYLPIAAAILDAGLVCTAALPCPAEMSASIHINGTGSSVIDTVFVCRRMEHAQMPATKDSLEDLKRAVQEDIASVAKAGHSVTQGDVRCLLLGHLVRLVVLELRGVWQCEEPVDAKLGHIRRALDQLQPFESLSALVSEVMPVVTSADPDTETQRETHETYEQLKASF